MEENKSVPTQFRLSQSERNFLEKIGQGNLAVGLRIALAKAGFKQANYNLDYSNVRVRRNYNFNYEEYSYIRIEHDKPVRTINIPLSVEQQMLNKFGENIYFEEVILKGLFPLDDEKQMLAQIESIVDVTSNKIVWKQVHERNS